MSVCLIISGKKDEIKKNQVKYFLKDMYDNVLTKDYDNMFYLSDDCYAVAERVINENEKSNFKWGIIKINRDSFDYVIPYKEITIIPFSYKEDFINALADITLSAEALKKLIKLTSNTKVLKKTKN